MRHVNLLGRGKSVLTTYTNTFRGLPKSVWKILSIHFMNIVLAGILYFLSRSRFFFRASSRARRRPRKKVRLTRQIRAGTRPTTRKKIAQLIRRCLRL